MSPLLRVEDVASLLQISPSTVYELTAAGKLHHIRIGARGKRYTMEHIQKFLEENES
jgi:excisionase family DNA binding protein